LTTYRLLGPPAVRPSVLHHKYTVWCIHAILSRHKKNRVLCVMCRCEVLWGSWPSQARELARGAADWFVSQSWYRKWDLLERKERLQLDQCSGARKPVACCTGGGWGFYGHSNSGLDGFFSLAMDSWAFSGELVWFAPLLGEGKQSWEHFAHQPCGRSIRPCISSSGYRNACLHLLLGMQESECSPWGMGYSSALGLQTQHLDWGFSSVTEGEFSMGEALGLIPNTKKTK
jgi:hypothetical protein